MSVNSSQTKAEILGILCNIRVKAKQKDNKKLQKLINYYAIEHDNMIVLKP
jgi:hypothetical protein